MKPEGDPALELRRCLESDGSLVVSPRVEIEPARRRELYAHMLRLRLLDQELLALQRQGRIGFYGSTRGQEAPPVAAPGRSRARQRKASSPVIACPRMSECTSCVPS